MKIRPLQDRVIVKRLEEEEKTKGGIIIPDSAKEKPQEGKVIAVGKGKVTEEGKVIPLDVKVGDKILFGKYSGTDVKIDGEEHLFLLHKSRQIPQKSPSRIGCLFRENRMNMAAAAHENRFFARIIPDADLKYRAYLLNPLGGAGVAEDSFLVLLSKVRMSIYMNDDERFGILSARQTTDNSG